MPVKLDPDDEPPSGKPDTNAHELLTVLFDHPEMGFAPKELAELTDVHHSSVHKTLTQLREKGLVRKVDSHWAVAEDATEIAPFALDHDMVIVTKDTDFLAMDSSEHAGIFFIANHELSAYEIATAILRVLEVVPDRDYLRTVVFAGDRHN